MTADNVIYGVDFCSKPVSATLHLIDQSTGVEISRHKIDVDGCIPSYLCADTTPSDYVAPADDCA